MLVIFIKKKKIIILELFIILLTWLSLDKDFYSFVYVR